MDAGRDTSVAADPLRSSEITGQSRRCRGGARRVLYRVECSCSFLVLLPGAADEEPLL